MEEVIKLIIKRNRERKVLTKEDVRFICNIIIKGKHYEDYVKGIHFKKVDPKDDNTAGMYDGENLYFYGEGLDNFADINFSQLDENIDGTRVDFINFFILVTIFHELAHVRQSVMQDFRKNKEGQLYTICEKLHNVDNFYEENYKYDLREVNAWALGFMNACEMYNNLPETMISPFDRSIYKSLAINKMLSSYSVSGKKEIVVSPSEKLFECADKYNLANYGVNKDKFDQLIHMGQDFSLYRKLCIGLPLSFDSFAYMNMLLVCSNSGDNFSFVKKMQHHK